MNKTADQIISLSRKSLAGCLVFWLSGILFLFCCQMPAAQATENDRCPLNKSRIHCGESVAKNTSPAFSNEPESASLDCCGFLPAVFDKTRKVEKNSQTAKASEIKIALPTFSPVKINSATIDFYSTPVFYQDKIFIKNCVFRI